MEFAARLRLLGCHPAIRSHQQRQIWRRPVHFAPPAGADSAIGPKLGAGPKKGSDYHILASISIPF